MIHQLSKHISPGEEGSNIQRHWIGFIEFMDLTDVEKNNSKNVYDVFKILMQKQDIQFGSYKIVKDAFVELELMNCFEIVKVFEDVINEPSPHQQGTVIKI